MAKQSKVSPSNESAQDKSVPAGTQEVREPPVDEVESDNQESDSDSDDEDFGAALNKTKRDDESGDEMAAALAKAKAQKKVREIIGFNNLSVKEWYEVRYLSEDLDSPLHEDQKIRVMAVQQGWKKRLLFFLCTHLRY